MTREEWKECCEACVTECERLIDQITFDNILTSRVAALRVITLTDAVNAIRALGDRGPVEEGK